DYDCDIRYHPGKANVVADALSRKERETPLKVRALDQPLPTDASPTSLLPGYINDSNPEEDEEDLKEDPIDYPSNGGDNDDNESSDDDVEMDGEACITEFAIALPSSLPPPPENIKSLKDHIKV
nr:putative reverse transcriptase domain-containing protein [Tanacetum cinerariifolium]